MAFNPSSGWNKPYLSHKKNYQNWGINPTYPTKNWGYNPLTNSEEPRDVSMVSPRFRQSITGAARGEQGVVRQERRTQTGAVRNHCAGSAVFYIYIYIHT